MKLRLLGELKDFLAPAARGRCQVIDLTRRAGLKDIIEAAGVPHTEIGRVRVDGMPTNLKTVLDAGSTAHVIACPVSSAERRARWPATPPAFVADVHLGALVRRLRLAGFDVRYGNDWDDAWLAEISDTADRVLLTRDRGLLKRARVRQARFVRDDAVDRQYRDVIAHFDLADRMAAFTRCSDCNTPLERVAKADILHRLAPLTRRHYTRFARCPACDKLFWGGSHVADMRSRL